MYPSLLSNNLVSSIPNVVPSIIEKEDIQLDGVFGKRELQTIVDSAKSMLQLKSTCSHGRFQRQLVVLYRYAYVHVLRIRDDVTLTIIA